MPERPLTMNERLIALESKKPEPSWFKTNALALGGVVVAVLTLALTLVLELSKHQAQDLESTIDKRITALVKPETIVSDLGKLQQQVKDMHEDVGLLLGKALKVSASLPVKQFGENADALSAQLAVAHKVRLPVDRGATNTLREKLRDSKATDGPAYWGLAAELVSYISTSSVPANVPLLDFR
jgi:hypothetical protein